MASRHYPHNSVQSPDYYPFPKAETSGRIMDASKINHLPNSPRVPAYAQLFHANAIQPLSLASIQSSHMDRDTMFMQSQYMSFAPNPAVAHYAAGAPRHKRSRLSDNIKTDAQGSFSNPDITLIVRQEPREALVLSAGKEKSRKPVDPPPIIQLKVNDKVEVSQHFTQSPHLFAVADLWCADKDERYERAEDRGTPSKSYLCGGLVSSLHRLKDIDNKDGAFFIFGDISVRATGTFRLQFSLYDLQMDQNAAVYLGSIMTKPFKVLAAKDFQGLEESTYLSRAFSDQGVRLRLRKEPRAFAGSKRSYHDDSQQSGSAQSGPTRSDGPFYENESPQQKRYRADTDDRKDSYTDPVPLTQPSYQPSSSYNQTPQPSYTSTNFPAALPQNNYAPSYTPGLSSNYPSTYTGSHSGFVQQPLSSSPYPVRPSIGNRPVSGYSQGINLNSIAPPNSMSQSSLSHSSIPLPNLSHSNLPQSNISHSNLPQSSISHSSLPQSGLPSLAQPGMEAYSDMGDNGWNLPSGSASWHHPPSSGP